MNYVYVHKMKTRQFTKNNAQGIHLKKPSTAAILNALEDAVKNGFTTVFVYDTAADLGLIASHISHELDISIGWRDFCVSMPAFKINFAA